MIHVKVVFVLFLGQIDRTKQVSLLFFSKIDPKCSREFCDKRLLGLVSDMLQKLNSSPKKYMETSQSNL